MRTSDADGDPLDCANQYVLHLEKDGLPAVGASRSVTRYDAEGVPAANPLNRFVSGGHDRLRDSADGSFDLSRHHDSPGSELGST